MQMKHLRETLYSVRLFQDISFFDREAVGDLTSRLGADCQRLSLVIANDISLILRNVLQGIGALINLLILSRPLALSTLFICCVLSMIFLLYGWYQKKAAKLVQDFTAGANEGANEVFATPEASIGFHTDCGFSYVSHLPGHLGEFFALTGARLNGKELVAAGLATHFVTLEKHLISLNSGDENAVKAAIEEFAVEVQPDEESVGLALGELRKENNFLRSLWPVTNPPSSQEHLLHPQLLQKPLRRPFLA
ncbi:hypothetical protein GBA52_019112 [Prunus armeniaca]|nr:hypothetical protein GBA52_019112 [Prunus armeniaca]